MQSGGFESLKGLVGFVARSVNIQSAFSLNFEPELEKSADINYSEAEYNLSTPKAINTDSSVLDWMDEALGEALRLRRF
ncbi:MAG: hypothetical protein KF824_05815 [Fimbriimonadaceae bacterium]|nr:MAG: hypothetical protein KF824_05815 [Fimbriimonadaceae bacterium]